MTPVDIRLGLVSIALRLRTDIYRGLLATGSRHPVVVLEVILVKLAAVSAGSDLGISRMATNPAVGALKLGVTGLN